MNDANGLKYESPAGLAGSGLMWAGGALLLAAWLIPLSEKLLDVLWICGFLLSAASAVVCLAARRVSDLTGFSPLLSGLILLRLVAQAAAGRHIVRDQPAGILLGWTGTTLAAGQPLAAVLICLLLAAICVFVVFVASQRVALAAGHYLRHVLGQKQTGVETDLRLGVIDADQADVLADRIADERRFFYRMQRIALLMRVEVVIAVIVLLACMVFPAAGSTVNLPYGTHVLSVIAPSVVALSIFSLIPAVAVAVTCGKLMSKESLVPLRAGEPGEAASPQAKRITVVALDSEGAEDTELLNPDFVQHRRGEQIAEFEPQDPPAPNPDASLITDVTCRNANEYYEKLSRVICSITSRPRVILLASDKVQSLPVTVAVNTAIRLSQENQRVLLVDTDAARNAVGSVFDLDAETMRRKVQASCLENLSVGCVPAEKLDPFLRNKKVLEYFSTILIYTPNLPDVRVTPAADAVKPGAFYFVDDGDSKPGKRTAEQQLAFCSWLCLIPSMQSVLDAKS